MRQLLGVTALLMVMLIVLPADELHAQNKNKKKGNEAQDSKTIDSAKLNRGEYVGTLKTMPGTDRIFLIEIETKQIAPGGGGGRNNNAAQLAQIQRQIATARTPQQRQQAIMRYQQMILRGNGGRGAGGKIQTVVQEIEFQASENVKVRTLALPEQFDEKGNIKKFTSKEIAQLKGKDRHLPGYESSVEKLEVGQKVIVILAPASVPARPVKKDEEEGEKPRANKRMQVKTIILLGENTGGSEPMRKGKGKKK